VTQDIDWTFLLSKKPRGGFLVQAQRGKFKRLAKEFAGMKNKFGPYMAPYIEGWIAEQPGSDKTLIQMDMTAFTWAKCPQWFRGDAATDWAPNPKAPSKPRTVKVKESEIVPAPDTAEVA
jgi:hypothetical protein